MGLPMLDNKVAVVTGSGRGIGRATAEILSDLGARLVINDIDAGLADGIIVVRAPRVARVLEHVERLLALDHLDPSHRHAFSISLRARFASSTYWT